MTTRRRRTRHLPAAAEALANKTLHDLVVDALAGLHDDAGQLAAALVDADVRGLPGDGLGHPLARWLTQTLGEGYFAWLSCGSVHVVQPPVAHALVPLPKAAARFVRLFDDGTYPELELDLGPDVDEQQRWQDLAGLPALPGDRVLLPLGTTVIKAADVAPATGAPAPARPRDIDDTAAIPIDHTDATEVDT